MQKDYSLSEIHKVAQGIISKAGHTKCIAFFAPMGAGKTTLIHAICDELKVVDNVSSPTYSIINEYKTVNNDTVTHMDWYRLKDEADALHAGVEDYLRADSYCLIEWPERAEGLLPLHCIKVSIEVIDEAKRSISILA